MVPEKAITSPGDLKSFIDSTTYADFNVFIRNCSQAVAGTMNSQVTDIPEVM